VGPQVAEVLGYPVASWIDDPQRWFEMVHPDDRDRLERLSVENWTSGGPWAVDFRMIAADGRVVWMHDRGRCVERDELGRPTRFVGVVMEVTQERETELRTRDDEMALRSLLEGLPAVTWTELSDTTTGWRRFAYMSPQTRELFGYEPEELMGESGHFERMVHPDDLPRVLARIDEADATGEPWVDEFRARHRVGSWRWFHSASRRLTSDGVQPSVWQGVTVDITDQRGEGRGGSAVAPAEVVVIDGVDASVTPTAGEDRYSG
jgi:PAS domain S-box-containing protein